MKESARFSRFKMIPTRSDKSLNVSYQIRNSLKWNLTKERSHGEALIQISFTGCMGSDTWEKCFMLYRSNSDKADNTRQK